MSHLDERLQAAIEVAPSLKTAAEALDAPPRAIAVIGSRSVGKSTLVNRLVDDEVCDTGLGGITEAVQVVDHGPLRWIDTPSIEDEVDALDVLQPLLETIDGVIWLVDGLQPLTRTERRVVAASLIPGTPLVVAVSRLDLVSEADHGSILDRVRSLTAERGPDWVGAADPRDPDCPIPEGRAPHRLEALRVAVAKVALELPELGHDPHALGEMLRARWRQVVTATTREVEGLLDDGRVIHKGNTMERMERAAEKHRSAMLDDLREDTALVRAWGLPDLPTLQKVDGSVFERVVDAMGGRATSQRALKATAGRWLLDGQVAVAEYVERVREDDDPELRATRRAVGELLRVLDGLRPPR